MLANITILNGNVLTRASYITYRSQLANVPEDLIKQLMRRCETGETEFPPDFPEEHFTLAETICTDIARSGGQVDPIAEETIHQHTHSEPETAPVAAITPEVLPPTAPTETLILEAARAARLEGGSYSKLREVFDFSEEMTVVRVREGVIVTPQDWGSLLGLSVDLGKKSCYLMGAAVNALMVSGHENSVIQYAGEIGLDHTTLYNMARVCRLVPTEKRLGLYPSVVQEIAVRRYDEDDEKNTAIVLELVDQARENKWTCQEARSHSLAKKHGEEPTDKGPTKKELEAEISEMDAFLHRFLTHYVAGSSETLDALHGDVRDFYKE